MATDLQTILSWFKTGLKPTQAQFWASWSSFWHKDEAIPQSSVSGLTNVLNAKVENDQFNAYKVANDARMQAKEDKTQKGAPNGYAPLDEFTKLAAQYLNIVNDLVTGGATALLSAEQGKVLQGQISAINTLLTSDNVNLDTVQELVDAIETVQLSLSSILVNDLTTGGTTKALTAEMGKLLQANKIDKLDSAFVEAMIGSDASSNPIIKVNSTKTNIVISVDNAGAGLITYIIFGAEFTPYDGKLFTITNKLNTDLTLGQAFFKTVNQVLHSGATVSFLYDSNNGNPVFRQIDGSQTLEQVLGIDNTPTIASAFIRNVSIGEVIPNSSPKKPNHEGILIGETTKLMESQLLLEDNSRSAQLYIGSLFLTNKETWRTVDIGEGRIHLNNSGIYGVEPGEGGRFLKIPINGDGDTDKQTIPIKINGKFADKFGHIEIDNIKLKEYTVSTLPAGTKGDVAFVNDAAGPSFLATVVGGGSAVVRVFYDGFNWIVQ